MTISNDYIPVIVPNDIDNEMEHIDPRDTASGSGGKDAGRQADLSFQISGYLYG